MNTIWKESAFYANSPSLEDHQTVPNACPDMSRGNEHGIQHDRWVLAQEIVPHEPESDETPHRQQPHSGGKGCATWEVHRLLGQQVEQNLFPVKTTVETEGTTRTLQTDVCQVHTKSHASSQYFMTVIDNHNQKLWVSTLKTKDHVLSVFKDFHARVERETDWKLKAIRVDNGGEYRG